MALKRHCLTSKQTFHHKLHLIRPSGRRVRVLAAQPDRSPAEQFAPLASTFQRRLLVGVGSASLVAVGANFIGITSFVLGLLPETGRSLKLDVLYPIGGYSRCIDVNLGFEFIYPATWVGDQTLLYRAAGRAEQERSLDLPPLDGSKSSKNRRKKDINEPAVAFGPPGSTSELNVSVIVSPIPLDFRSSSMKRRFPCSLPHRSQYFRHTHHGLVAGTQSVGTRDSRIEAYGGPKEVGQAVIRSITGSARRPDLKAELIDSNLRQDTATNVNYYELEFRVQSPSFQRHNVAVCCAKSGRLYTLNAQAPESHWPKSKKDLYTIASSFSIT